MIVSGCSAGAVYTLVGLGYNVVYAASRVFNFAQGQILMVAVMVLWQLRQQWGWPTVPAIGGAVVCAALVNLAIERVAVTPLLRRGGGAGQHPLQLASLITTLGASIILLNLAIVIWGPDTKPFTPYFPFDGIDIGRVTIGYQQMLMVALAVALATGYHLYTTRTRWGTGLAAMSEDAEAAALRGVPVARGRMLAFVLAGAISGLGGAAIGPIAFANPAMGFGFGLKGFVAIAIGGFGSILGALVGGLVLGLSEAAVVVYWDDKYRAYAGLVLVLAVLLVRPKGLFGRVSLRE
ncbi:MAG: branched-chain amino acid ABC transporter permease, partial [Acidimicrobiales bacterium]